MDDIFPTIDSCAIFIHFMNPSFICRQVNPTFYSYLGDLYVYVQVRVHHYRIAEMDDSKQLDIYSRMRLLINRYPHVKPPLVAARRATRFAYDPFSGRTDYSRFCKRYPQLGAKEELSERFPKDLSVLYDRYVSEVSNRVMAASIELSRFAYAFCSTMKPHRIADFGSGFSSVVLRHYQKYRDSDVQVWSVDDSCEWLEKTGEYLRSHNLPMANLLSWEAMKAENPGSLDLILYDLGHVRELRKEAIEDALNMVSPGGVIILDDMNFIGYKMRVKQLLRNYDFETFNLSVLTIDSLGRYSYLLVRRNS